MTKRFIASLVMVVMLTSMVSAEEFVSENSTSQQSTVVYSVPSEYVVLIPETIVADGREYKFQASVMDILGNEHVDISIAGIEDGGDIQMFAESGRWALSRLHSSRGEVHPGSVLATFNQGMTESIDSFYVTHERDEGPGNYQASITFNIQLVKE